MFTSGYNHVLHIDNPTRWDDIKFDKSGSIQKDDIAPYNIDILSISSGKTNTRNK